MQIRADIFGVGQGLHPHSPDLPPSANLSNDIRHAWRLSTNVEITQQVFLRYAAIKKRESQQRMCPHMSVAQHTFFIRFVLFSVFFKMNCNIQNSKTLNYRWLSIKKKQAQNSCLYMIWFTQKMRVYMYGSHRPIILYVNRCDCTRDERMD